MYKIRVYAIFKDSKSKQYRVICCFCMERLCNKSSSYSKTDNSSIITEEMYEIDIPIYIEKDWITYEYNSFARGYHAYMNVWNPLVEETLKCRQEPSNEVDKNAVAIIRSDSWEKLLLGTFGKTFPKLCQCFWKSLRLQLKSKL